jgi:hypothetical protein
LEISKGFLAWLALTAETVVTGIIVYYVFSQQLFFITAIGHTMDFTSEENRTLARFFWAMWILPVAWLVGLLVSFVKLLKTRRRLLGSLLILPVLVGAVYWSAWTYFIKFGLSNP